MMSELTGRVTSKTATNQNGHNQNGHKRKRPQTKTATKDTKTATFYQQVKSPLVIKFSQLQQKSWPAELCQQVHYCVHDASNRQFLQTKYCSFWVIISYRKLHLH